MGFPPSSLKGQNTSKLNAKWNLQVPLNQATDLGGIDALIETGNENLIANPGFEANNVTGWTTYADAAGTSPVDGTGGSPTVTFSATATTPLSGVYSALFTKDAANRQGEGVSYALTLNRKDRNQLIDISFDYEIASGTYASGDVGVFIYDVTNAVLINPLIIDLPSLSGTGGKFLTQFQATSSTSYRLIFHVRTTSASAYTIEIDNVVVQPSKSFVGNIVTDWQSYTPTFTGFGTVTNVNAEWRRVGNDVEIRVRAQSGTLTNVEGRVSLPIGLLSSSTLPTLSVARGFWIRGSASTAHGGAVLIEPNVNYVTFGNQQTFGSVSVNPLAKVNVSTDMLNNTEVISFFASVPIQGWSSTTSAGQGIGVVPYLKADSATTSFSALTTAIFTNTVADSTGSYNSSTGEWTCPETGFYEFDSSIRTASVTLSTTQNIAINVTLNGSTTIAQSLVYGNGSSNQYTCICSGGHPLRKGDVITIRIFSSVSTSLNGTAGGNYFVISKTDKNMFSQNQRITARAVQTSGQSIPNTGTATLVTWDTAETFDTHNAFNPSTGTFTAPVDGDYRVSTHLLYGNPTWTVNDGANIFIYKNGAVYSRQIVNIQATTSQLVPVSLSDLVRLNAGDTIQIYTAHNRTGGATTLSTTTGVCFVAISKEN